MRKWGALAIGIVLLISLATPVNAAAPKAGATCAKKNATVTSGGKLYTCILSGKKLVWNKGVALPKPTPSPTKPTAIGDPIGAIGSTPTPTPSPKPSETVLPTPNPTPTSIITVDPIRIKAYESIKNFKCGSTHSNINYTIQVGPNFPSQLKEKVDSILINEFNCFNEFFDRAVPLKLFYVTQSDRSFVQSTVNPAISPGDVAHMNSVMDDMDAKKWGNEGMAGGFVNWNRDRTNLAMVIHVTDGFNWQEKDNHLVAHEFTHVMQQMYRSNLRSDVAGAWYTQIPGYMAEGGAETIGYFLESKSVESLDSQLREVANYMSRDPAGSRFKNASSESEMLERMKEIVSPSDPGSSNIQYPLGQLICEFIVGQFGFDKFLKLIQNTGTYSSFSENLQKTIGITQEQLLIDAAPYVFRQWKLAVKI